MIDLNRVYHERLRQSGAEQLTDGLRVERLIQTQGRMWAKSVPRPRKRQPAGDDPVVEDPEGAVRVDGKDNDIRLQESLRKLEGEGDRPGLGRDWLKFVADFLGTGGGRNRTRARGSGEGNVRRLIPGKPRIVTLVDLANSLRDLSRQLCQNENSIQLQALLAVMAGDPQNWNENTIGIEFDSSFPLISRLSMRFPGCE